MASRLKPLLERASLATIGGLIPHYFCFYAGWSPLWTDTIAEWIMARTPSAWALWILSSLGSLAKPFAATGGLAVLGFLVFLTAATPRWLRPFFALGSALAAGWLFEYRSLPGQLSFWLGALAVLHFRSSTAPQPAGRREALAMMAGSVLVLAESLARETAAARRPLAERVVAPFSPPSEQFATGLVRPAVTPVQTFYAMSKNTVDPTPDPDRWRLRITAPGRAVQSVSYSDILALPSVSEYVTLRCISNTLQSDLMGTALWTGVRLSQLIPNPPDALEIAVIGVDGHGDSFPVEYLLSNDAMLAYGMNGRTLNRTHGFPLRLIVPRYYGFKNVKWIGEISLVREPYFGTWPKMGYTKDPRVHTASHIDKYVRENGTIQAGGVSFAGDRGIRQVQLRAGTGPWVDATLERPISRFTWTRWHATVEDRGARQLEARAMDGAGRWQESEAGPLFPDGVKGPTIRRLT